MIVGLTTLGVVSLLQYLGIYNPPDWLVYALLAAVGIYAIALILSGIGIVSVPAWLLTALDVASTFAE